MCSLKTFTCLKYIILATPLKHMAAKPSVALTSLESNDCTSSVLKVLASPLSLAATYGIEHDPLPDTHDAVQ